jgi:hypothetical protein
VINTSSPALGARRRVFASRLSPQAMQRSQFFRPGRTCARVRRAPAAPGGVGHVLSSGMRLKGHGLGRAGLTWRLRESGSPRRQFVFQPRAKTTVVLGLDVAIFK